MKKLFAVTALVIFSSTMAFAQSAPAARDTDNTGTRYDEPRHNNWSWIGVLGLAGLAGLRRQKSESVQRFESRGVKVGTI